MGHNHSKRKDSVVSSIDKLEIVKEEKLDGRRRKTRRSSSKVEIIENKAPEKEVEKKQEEIAVVVENKENVVENNENEDKQNENNDKQPEPEVDIRKVQIIEVEEEKKVGYILDTSETERQWREKEEQEKLKKEQQEKDKVNDIKDEEKEPEKEKEKEKQLCPLCEKEVPIEEIHSLQTCGHSICFHCIYEFLKTILDEGEKPSCPVENCDTPVHISDLKAALEVFGAIEKEGEIKMELPGEKKEEEFQYPSLRESVGVLPVSLTQSLEMYIASNEFVIRCPNPNCGNIFERLPPTKTNEVVKDDKGQPLSKEALNHYFENRFRCRLCTTIFCAQCNANPYHLGKTCRQNLEALQAKSCRYCGEPVSESALPYKSGVARESWVSRLRKKIEYKKANDIDFKGLTQDKINQLVAERDARMEASGEFFVCSEDECQEKAKMSCPVVTKCKHLCGGVKGEKKCLRCLKPECVEDGSTTNEDYCNICWVEDIASAPSIELTCGHIFHFNCIKQRVDEGWSTSYISFTFANCPLCSTPINHPLLELQELRNLEIQVKDLAVQRLSLEGMKDDAELLEGGPYFGREADYGILKLAFYQCARCKKPYFGGRKQCDPGAGQENEGGRKFNKEDLVCGTCAGVNSTCPVHGQETVEFKCRFCCSLATFFCAGLTHFCTPCHDIAGQMVDFADWSTKWDNVKPCSGIETCPLGVPHPRNGEEYSLGCGLCRIQRLAERESEKKKE